MRRAWRCAPGIIAPCRSWSSSGSRPRRAHLSPAIRANPTSMRWSARWRRHVRYFPDGVGLMDLKDLYREVILDHNKSPRLFGRLEPADSAADGHNPLCGDRLSITVRLEGDRLSDLRFEGKGCAISVASASLMCEAVKGKSRGDIANLFNEVHTV